MNFTTQSRISTKLEHLRLMPQFQTLAMNLKPDITSCILDHRTPSSRHLLLLTTQEINITTHPTLRIFQNHRITLILESAAGVELTYGSDMIALTAMGYTNPYIELMSPKIFPKNTQKTLGSVGP